MHDLKLNKKGKLRAYQPNKSLKNMTLVKVDFLKIAETELNDAFEYYESEQKGLRVEKRRSGCGLLIHCLDWFRLV